MLSKLEIDSKQVVTECEATLKWITDKRIELELFWLERYQSEEVNSLNLFRWFKLKAAWYPNTIVRTKEEAWEYYKRGSGSDHYQSTRLEKIRGTYNAYLKIYRHAIHSEAEEKCEHLLIVASSTEGKYYLTTEDMYTIKNYRSLHDDSGKDY